MDDVRYMCFCRSIFSSLNAFDSHISCCEHIKNASALNTNPETFLNKKYPEVRDNLQNVESGSDFSVKLMKSWTIVVDNEQDSRKPDKMATNLWGRRLPRRTKVPYLSRAVPLSTDHSYERCQCGAVFVTRMGKRQHQARFCKFVKNKAKKPASEELNELSQSNIIKQISSSNNDIITRESFIVTFKKNDNILPAKEHSLQSSKVL